jgi:hypothetical protein
MRSIRFDQIAQPGPAQNLVRRSGSIAVQPAPAAAGTDKPATPASPPTTPVIPTGK